jgi:membrane protein YqaA with SNARE-associated domain
MDLRRKASLRVKSSSPPLPNYRLAILGTMLSCGLMYLALLWLFWHANFFGGLLIAAAAASFGSLASVLLARVCNRVLAASQHRGSLNASRWLTVIAVAIIGYLAMHRIPTASWLTGIGGLGLLGPILFVPLAFYSWTIGKRFSFLM